MADKQIHLGRNVKRIREIMGVKQDALGIDLDMSQQGISQLEQKAEIDDQLIERIAQALKVPAESIKNFNEDASINIISNTFHDFKDNASAVNYNCDLTFNPIDKIVELYERLLQAERERAR